MTKLVDKIHTDTVVGYLDFLAQQDSLCKKIYYNSEQGVPDKVPRIWKIFYKDGTTKSVSSWSSLKAHILDPNPPAPINLEKIKQYIKNTYKDIALSEIRVTILVESEEQPEESPLVESEEKEEIPLTQVKKQVSMDSVREMAEQKSAKEFKKWLREYLFSFPTVDFKFAPATGVSKILSQLEEYLEENK